jgi:hypothetical protein
MEGLRIVKPAVIAEGENINYKALVNQATRRRAMRRNRPIVEEEEVWSVDIPNIQNVNDEEVYANTKTPVRPKKQSYNWIFNKPQTPKAQMVTPKNQPPPLRRGGRRIRKSKRTTQRRNR